jgi:phosphoglycolate phosphatase-like HAD superfamily hydrolase
MMPAPPSVKKCVAFDFDGVIADTNARKSLWISENLPNVSVPFYYCDRTNCVAVIGQPAYTALSAYAYSAEQTRKTSPVNGALSGIRTLAARFRVIVITARSAAHTDVVDQWLSDHGFAEHIDSVVSAVREPKLKIAERLDALALVDDDMRHLVYAYGTDVARVRFCPRLMSAAFIDLDVHHVGDWLATVEVVEALRSG